MDKRLTIGDFSISYLNNLLTELSLNLVYSFYYRLLQQNALKSTLFDTNFKNSNVIYETEELVYLDEKTLTDLYKSGYSETQDNFTYFDDVSSEVERLRELMQKLSDFDKKVYRLVLIEERTKTETANILCVSEGTVRYHLKNIRKFIKNNF